MSLYRPARLEDLPQIREINSHYILHTSLTFMRTPPPLPTYIKKWNDLKNQGLPYIVAIDPDRKQEGGLDMVLGYASFSPFRGHLVSYAPTVELSLFVHPDHHSKSIGSNLLNNLLDLVRIGKVRHYCEEAVAEAGSDDATESRSATVISQVRNVIAVMAVDPEGRDGGERLRNWYIERGLKESGRLKSVGFKRGHW
ncbi:hypothetical protein N7462_011489 [Penicillium macrosclerotiorum]|uniref:uncharacterized protein n=1 Tax=Penicillium macrosclerotiorum TaxID=303699 RepID=UPI00254824D0|nr:uncharacterized protein N7462_011489 [Penicillium macrosclerotiorum]KAJ5664676.1 hypothetical protein N7462_011489 [Penicillium macrosclerotiorum]